MKNTLKPGIYERPVARIRHTCPNGEIHQSTLSSTWPARFLEDGFTQDEIHGHRVALTHLLRSYYEGMGCEFLSLELIQTTTVEVEGSIR